MLETSPAVRRSSRESASRSTRSASNMSRRAVTACRKGRWSSRTSGAAEAEDEIMLANAAEFSLKNGDPSAALAQLQDQVRAKPDDPKLRVFLFQLLCLVGKWDRALNQLSVAAGLDA